MSAAAARSTEPTTTGNALPGRVLTRRSYFRRLTILVLTTSYPPWAGVRVRPLAWGMTAPLAGTMAANFFYLPMQFHYFSAFGALAPTLPVVFAKRRT
jgi:hypothetical protein